MESSPPKKPADPTFPEFAPAEYKSGMFVGEAQRCFYPKTPLSLFRSCACLQPPLHGSSTFPGLMLALIKCGGLFYRLPPSLTEEGFFGEGPYKLNLLLEMAEALGKTFATFLFRVVLFEPIDSLSGRLRLNSLLRLSQTLRCSRYVNVTQTTVHRDAFALHNNSSSNG